MRRAAALLYGAVCYLIFFGTFLYAISFVWRLDAPRPAAPWPRSFLINTGLLALFAVQHSVMARQWFKRRWTLLVPTPVERSTYVLIASSVLLLLFHRWQAMPAVIWTVQNELARLALHGLFGVGWVIVLISTFLIDHFDLFGLKQVWTYWRGQSYQPPAFQTPGLYKWVRHPIYLGFLIAFWSTPQMTMGRLYFAAVSTAYILLAIQFEERDLIGVHGETYRLYRSGVSMLAPWPKKKKLPPAT
jgi:protein-S-isoprenylcysteine O-methyltransferase Ste14